jgi:hypothetical protein
MISNFSKNYSNKIAEFLKIYTHIKLKDFILNATSVAVTSQVHEAICYHIVENRKLRV